LKVPPPKLSFSDVMTESFGFFFDNIRLFFHLVTVPWILSLALRVAGAGIDEDSPLLALIEKAADFVPTIMFMVAWMRVVLLGPHQAGRLPGLSWTPRETAFLVHLLKVGGITFLLIAAFMLVIDPIDSAMLGSDAPVDPDLARREALAAPLGAGFVVSALLALRVSFGLAATAVDVPFDPRRSWACSRGDGWTIVGVLFLVFLSSGMATLVSAFLPYRVIGGLGAELAGQVAGWTSGILVSYGGTAIAATAQAIIFRRLTGWREGVPLST
jgi:hypothetical protein